MTTLEFQLTRRDRINSFFTRYYSYPGWKYVRILGGPFLVAIGLVLQHVPTAFHMAYGGFAIGFGIYYLLKPFLYLAIRWRTFAAGGVTLALDDEEMLSVTDGGVNARVSADTVRSARIANGLLAIEIKVDRRAFLDLPLRALTSGDAGAFIEAVRTRTASAAGAAK